MKTTKWFASGVVAISLLAASMLMPAPAAAQHNPPGQRIKLLSKNIAGWDGISGFVTVLGFENIYEQTVKSQPPANVMDVLVSFVSFNDDDCLGIQCLVDGVPCMNVGNEPLALLECGFPSGTVASLDDDDDDASSTSYNFCQVLTKTPKHLHVVDVNLLSDFDDVFIDGLVVEVSSARVADPALACALGAIQGNALF